MGRKGREGRGGEGREGEETNLPSPNPGSAADSALASENLRGLSVIAELLVLNFDIIFFFARKCW